MFVFMWHKWITKMEFLSYVAQKTENYISCMLLRYMVIITKTKDRKCYKWPPIGKQNQEYSGVIYAQNINHLIQNNYGSKLSVKRGQEI